MARRLDVQTGAPRTAESEGVTGRGQLETFLAVLAWRLRLPEAQRDAIRSELHAHIVERARDLMIVGHGEDTAVRTAIEELGETAELARRLAAAHRFPRRRLAMNLSLVGLGLGALGLGAVALVPSESILPVRLNLYEALASVASGVSTFASLLLDVVSSARMP